jgi:hypothetical protein
LLTEALASPGGGVMTLDAAMKPRSYILEMDKDATATVFKINVTSPGTYGIFAEVCAQQLSAPILPVPPVISFSCPFRWPKSLVPLVHFARRKFATRAWSGHKTSSTLASVYRLRHLE